MMKRKSVYHCRPNLNSDLTLHQLVRRQAWVQYLLCTFNASDWKYFSVDETHLGQNQSLIPVDMLMRQFAIAEMHNHHQRNLDVLSRRRNSGQHPVHLNGVCELKHHLVYNSIDADGARNRRHAGVRGHLRNETLCIELAQLGMAHTAGEHRNMIDVSVRYHRP